MNMIFAQDCVVTTDQGNSHFTKWLFAFAVPDQKSERIARLLVEEGIPCFGVLKALLSDSGTNLSLHLMMDGLTCHLEFGQVLTLELIFPSFPLICLFLSYTLITFTTISYMST